MQLRDFGPDEILYLLMGARWTILLSLAAFAGGGLVGALLTLLRVAPLRPLRWIAAAWIGLVQAIPVLMVLLLFYFGLNLFGIRTDAWTAAVAAFTFTTSAFLAEIWRGCVEAVPKGQWEASRALGLGFLRTMRLVVLPQALRMALPPTVGYMVQVVKGTSLAALIGFTELARAGTQMNTVTFQPVLVFGTVSLMYFAMCWPLSLLSRHLEKRLQVEHVRVAAI
jgi:polar amino acid transport system permease protein